jgi:hypothetical protein
VRHTAPTVLEATASPVRAWQEDVRLAAGRVALPGPGDLLPAPQAGVLLKPFDLAALIGPPEPTASPDGPLAVSATNDWGPGEPHPAARSAPRPPHPAPFPPAPRPAAAGAGAAAWPSGPRPGRWPASPQRRAVPVPTAVPGAGAARIAVILQRYRTRETAAAAGSLTPPALGEGSSPQTGQARSEPGRRKAGSRVSAPGSRGLVARSARPALLPAVLRSRLDADRRHRAMQDTVAGRLRRWSQGTDLPSLPDPGRSAAAAARPAEPPSTSPPSAGQSRTPGGVHRAAGPASAGRRPAPAAEVSAGPRLAKLIDLAEQAVGGLAAVERRLADHGAQDVPRVQWLEDDELAGRLQAILARQARQRGIDLS